MATLLLSLFWLTIFKGIPLDNDDAMFHPPVSSRTSHYEIPLVSYQEASPLPPDSTPPTPPSVSVVMLILHIDSIAGFCRILNGGASLRLATVLSHQTKIFAVYFRNVQSVKGMHLYSPRHLHYRALRISNTT